MPTPVEKSPCYESNSGEASASLSGHPLRLFDRLHTPQPLKVAEKNWSLTPNISNPLMKDFGERLKGDGLAPKAVIAACMRKLV